MNAEQPDSVAAAAKRWADFFETLAPDSLDALDRLCCLDLRFKDPFNDVTGTAKMRRIFEHMFETVEDPRFVVTDMAVSNHTAYLRWDFTFRPKGGGQAPWTISGLSEVDFDADFKVLSHIDHWDAGEQFYARLPVLGWLIGKVRARLSVE